MSLANTTPLFEALRGRLTAYSPLSAAVGPRISRELGKQGDTLPMVTMHLLERDDSTNTDLNQFDNNEEVYRMQIDCDGITPASAADVAKLVVQAMGTASSPSIEGWSLDDVSASAFPGNPIAISHGADALFRTSVFLTIHFRQS